MKIALNSSLVGAGALALTFFASSTAFAHIDLLTPEARAHGSAAGGDSAPDPGADQKSVPCGQETNGRTERVATYAPGETISLTIREETNHASYYRVWLQPDGDANIPQRPVESVSSDETLAEAMEAEMALDAAGDADGRLLDVLVDDNDVSGMELTYEVTLPTDVTCDNCTLQIIQFMYDRANPYYYQCADLVIAEDASTAGGAMAGDAGAGGMGMGGSGMAGAGMGGSGMGGSEMDDFTGPVETDGEDDDSCSVSTPGQSGTSVVGWFALALAGLGVSLRRRRS